MLRILNSHVLRLRHVRLSSSTATIPNSDNSHKSSHFSGNFNHLINEDIVKGNPVPVFKRALLHQGAVALKDVNGEFSFLDLLASSKMLSEKISQIAGKCL